MALVGAIELSFGVPFLSLSAKWDALSGRQHGLLGTAIVLAAAVLIFGTLLLVGWAYASGNLRRIVMTPKINGIDHVHVYVGDRQVAERWYADTLGFVRVEELAEWATVNGPLTLQDASGHVHLAVFEKENPPTTATIAFGTDGRNFLEWKSHLEHRGLKLRLADHELAYSLYFNDPWGNYHEITTMDHDFVAARLH